MKETITISDTFPSPILSPACGVDVTIRVSGTLRVLSFPNRPVGPQDLLIRNLEWVATTGNNQVRFRNVKVDRIQVEPDGTVIESVSGHQPVEYTGVMKVNLDTGETVLEPQHIADIGRLCALLTAWPHGNAAACIAGEGSHDLRTAWLTTSHEGPGAEHAWRLMRSAARRAGRRCLGVEQESLERRRGAVVALTLALAAGAEIPADGGEIRIY
jgi:hypothetical protein